MADAAAAAAERHRMRVVLQGTYVPLEYVGFYVCVCVCVNWRAAMCVQYLCGEGEGELISSHFKQLIKYWTCQQKYLKISEKICQLKSLI